MTSKLELKLPKWICSYLRLFESSFSQQCDWKTKNAYVFHFSDIHLFPLLVFMFSSADNDILYQRQQASPDEFVSRPVRAIALCIPTVHHFRRKMHAHLRERKTPWGRGKEDGVGGWGLTGHAHRYVLILPLFFGVEASLEDHSSSRRFTFDRRECLVEPPAL